MRKGKTAALSPSPIASGSASISRRQSFISAVHSLAADIRDSKNLTLARFTAVRKSDDDPALASIRSKSCSNLPATVYVAPLLTLVLGSSSFLNTAVSDDGKRLYVIDTKGARTNICREDFVQGSTHVSAINWFNERDGNRPVGLGSSAIFQMAHGRQYYVEEFLRRKKLSSSWLFNIPHYPHSLKWKRSGGGYKLVLSKTKLTIATFEPAVLAAPPRIKIFEKLYDRDEIRPQLEYRGVPISLLDYILATALLVVADKDEWRHAGNGTSTASGSGVLFRPVAKGSIHRWRFGVQTEPFTELSSPSTSPAPSSVGQTLSSSNLDRGGDTSLYTSNDLPSHRHDVRLCSLPSSLSTLPRPSRTSSFVTAHPFASACLGSDEEVEIASDESVVDFPRLSHRSRHPIGAGVDGDEGCVREYRRAESASASCMSFETLSLATADLQLSQPQPSTTFTPVPQRTISLSATESRRPFRPLPCTPTLASETPPLPSVMWSPALPLSERHTSGPIMASAVSAAPSTSSLLDHSIAGRPAEPEPGPSYSSRSTALLSSTSEEPSQMFLRRIASETALVLQKSAPEGALLSSSTADHSLLKSVQRPSPHEKCAVSPIPNRTFSMASHAHRALPVTAPLHIRNLPQYGMDSIASSSSTFSHSSRPSIYFPPSQPSPDEYDYPEPLPSYDSIDFSRP